MFQLLLFSQLMILTALGNEWSKNYNQENLCALKGSTVIMNLTYTHPTDYTVKDRFWIINPAPGKEWNNLHNEPGYSGRVQYLEHGQNHFSLRLSDVKETDEHMYCVRVLGEKKRTKDKYLFYPGVTLTVTELRVETPENVVEGNKTVLVCNTTCSLSETPAFIWYKNDRLIDTKNSNNTLTLQPTKAGDAGRYNCAVRGYDLLRSPARTLNVRYHPKNVSVSISPSGEIVEGSSVTLTCSSDANPPVQTYKWFKGTTSVGTEKTYTISKISSEDSGEYKCKCSNEVGHHYSNSVTLNVLLSDSTVIVYVAVGLGLFGLAALLSALFWLRSRRQKKVADEGDYQNAGPSAQNDTYATLDPASWGGDDVYHTLAISHPSPAADTPTSHDYENTAEFELTQI
ncbi:carcinoembryonic antigen-related cell adhesion molecule 6-like isoform X2 [Hemibagrus wyckioides]|uniref:carcinoembryonic antigen-related cell adhesion molecule 6-like isoform X2 n=1 Tax=Hemibagrus wyckioides TaxID=337641 RepID=UPI00266B8A86|nr:carcinoembryonic antigen-related cell adhesion molecule 6-like isoform X2 [Hemibagrus wyckioides]